MKIAITAADILNDKEVKSLQTNAICERCHQVILQEFYQIVFKKPIYTELATLQANLDEWLLYYNHH